MNSVNIEKTVDFPFGFGRSKTVTVFEEAVAAGGPLIVYIIYLMHSTGRCSRRTNYEVFTT